MTLRPPLSLCKGRCGTGVVTSRFSNPRSSIPLLGKALSYCFLITFTLHIPQSSHSASVEGSHAEFLLYGKIKIFFFLLLSEIVHLLIVLRYLFEASVCIGLHTSPPHTGLFTVTEVLIWYEALREPFSFCCPAD